jgi:hypothetical protein
MLEVVSSTKDLFACDSGEQTSYLEVFGGPSPVLDTNPKGRRRARRAADDPSRHRIFPVISIAWRSQCVLY